ncbi:MAG: LnmK family bifunctional acyltransferase/decarboxylase [bacterium]
MHSGKIEHRIRRLLERVLEQSLESASEDAHILNDLGADSWQYLEFRNEVETAFGITIPDAEVDRLSTLRESASLVSQLIGPEEAGKAAAAAVPGAPIAGTKQRLGGGSYLREDGALRTDLEIGMALTGRNHLAESPLMKFVGEIRWNHIAHFAGVPSKKLSDETGERLYATFYYVETLFPRQTPMAAFGENDRFTVVSSLSSFGNSILDGCHFLYPAGWPEEKKVPLLNGRQAAEMGIPYVRTSNIFVKMLQGATWLKKSRPAQKGMDDVPRLAEVPDSYVRIKQAEGEDRFWPPPEAASPLTPGKVRLDYRIEPDRDLNGVGLLYFANYPMILDIAERKCLREMAAPSLSDDLLDLRTLVRRESAYLGNAHQSDAIDVWVEAWIENPFLARHPAPEMSPVRLFLNYQMYRRSDGRKIIVSSAEKVIFGRTLEDTGLLGPLREMAGAAGAVPA